MSLILADRIKETTTTTGTGTYTLGGASTGFESFSVVGNGNTTYYCCTDGTDFEVGIGTYTLSGTTLARTTILQSSNSDSAVDWGAGSKDIFVTQPAEKVRKQNTYSSATNLVAFETVLANTTSSAFTLTLPSSPRENDEIIIADAAGTFNSNNLTIGRNGNTIQGNASDLVCDISNVVIRLLYMGSDWRVFTTVGAAGGSAVTLTGTQTLTNKTLTNPTINNYTEGTVAIGNTGTSHTFSLTSGTFQTATLNGNCTFTMPTAATGKSFILKLTQGGSNTATFTNVKFPGGTAPTITATINAIDIISFISDGTNWYGTATQDYQ